MAPISVPMSVWSTSTIRIADACAPRRIYIGLLPAERTLGLTASCHCRVKIGYFDKIAFSILASPRSRDRSDTVVAHTK